MFTHLLVPLDGSRLAEAALPPAARLVEIFDARVTLFHVIERNAPSEVHGQRHLRTPAGAYKYLGEIGARAFPDAVGVNSHVHTSAVGNVAESIVAHADELASDLIVMCTHGRGGLREWLFGSIAQQVVAAGTTPILLIRPTADVEERERPFACRQILVPLDGNSDHEQSVPIAAELASACGARLHLTMAVPTRSTLSGEHAIAGVTLPGTISTLLDMAAARAELYLRRHRAVLQATGLDVTTGVARGDPASCIVSTALRANADLIVLGTHGKAGADAFWSGSVAPKVSNRTKLPLLLIPVHDGAGDHGVTSAASADASGP